jgi:hypothetical protein
MWHRSTKEDSDDTGKKDPGHQKLLFMTQTRV